MSSHEWEDEALQTKVHLTELTIDINQKDLVLQYLTMMYVDCQTVILLDKYCIKAFSLLARQQLWLSKYLHILNIIYLQQYDYLSHVATSHNDSNSSSTRIILQKIRKDKFMFWDFHDNRSTSTSSTVTNSNTSPSTEDEGEEITVLNDDKRIQILRNYLLKQAVRHSLIGMTLSVYKVRCMSIL